MSIKYQVEYFSNDDQCWFYDDSTTSFQTLDAAVSHLRRCADSDPDMAHRVIKTETIALSVRGDTLISEPEVTA